MELAGIFLLLLAASTKATRMNFDISGDYGQFSSPNYPQSYPVNVTCQWTIRTPPDTRILLNFTDFKMEINKKCLYDFIAIKESKKGWGMISSKYCGHGSIKTYLSQGNRLMLFFVSDKLGNVDTGFLADWTMTDKYGSRFSKKESSSNQVRNSDEIKPTKCFCGGASQNTLRSVVGISQVGSIETVDDDFDDGKLKTLLLKETIGKSGDKCRDTMTNFEVLQSRNRRLVVLLGCLLFFLAIVSLGLVTFVCRKDNSRSSLTNTKMCIMRKESNAWTTERFYPTYSKQRIRMVDGDIVVVSTEGKVLDRQESCSNISTLKASDTSAVINEDYGSSYYKTELKNSIHPLLMTPPERYLTLYSDDLGGFYEFRSVSDAESDYY